MEPLKIVWMAPESGAIASRLRYLKGVAGSSGFTHPKVMVRFVCSIVKNKQELRDSVADESIGPMPLFLSSKALQPFIGETFDGMDLSTVAYRRLTIKCLTIPAVLSKMLRLNNLNKVTMTFATRYSGYGKWWWYTPRHKWFEHNPCNPFSIPQVPGCYVITLDGKAIYIGQTLNLRSRFYKHKIKLTEINTWQTRWGVLSGDLRLKVKFGQRYGDWCMREARLINRLSPLFNIRAI